MTLISPLLLLFKGRYLQMRNSAVALDWNISSKYFTRSLCYLYCQSLKAIFLLIVFFELMVKQEQNDTKYFKTLNIFQLLSHSNVSMSLPNFHQKPEVLVQVDSLRSHKEGILFPTKAAVTRQELKNSEISLFTQISKIKDSTLLVFIGTQPEGWEMTNTLLQDNYHYMACIIIKHF